MIERLKTNRSNWTGEIVIVDVDRSTMRWSQDGYTYWLELIPPSDMEVGPGYYKIRGDGWGPDFSLGTVFQHGDEYIAIEGDMTREAPDPVEAAVKLLSNTI